MTILLCKLLGNGLDEVIVEFLLNEVDGTATEAATHNASAGYATLLGNSYKEIKLLATYLIVA